MRVTARTSSAHLKTQNRCRRPGLAPLELTLSLPILLFVMALMVIVGTTAAWKARAVGNARQAVWRTLWPRLGASDPHPTGWPESADLRVEASQKPPLERDPYLQHEVVRGPRVTARSGEWIPVRQGLLDMKEHLQLGVAELERPYPMLRRMGRLDFEREHGVLDRPWTFREMGLSSNVERRILFLYPVDLSAQLAQEGNRYAQAALAIITNPNWPILKTLDDDDELQQHAPSGLTYDPPYGIGYAPDYHYPEGRPRAELLNPELVCSFEAFDLRDRVVDPLIPEILNVPDRLKRDFLRMYRDHVNHIEDLLRRLGIAVNPGDIPMPDPNLPLDVRQQLLSQVGAMQANRQVLNQLIDQLESFNP